MRKVLLVKRLSIVSIACIFSLLLLCVLGFISLVLLVVLSFGGTATFPADCAVVFGAAVHRNSTAGPGIIRRVRTATDLYNNKQVNTLYFTGGFGSTYQEKSEAMVMKELALKNGVKDKDIVLEERSTSTWENLVYTGPMVQDCESVVGISDRYHLARIRFLAKKQGWGSLQTHPATWHASVPFEIYSVIRETLGFVYYSIFTPGETLRGEFTKVDNSQLE